MEKFRNKYRIPSARLKSWDYGWNGSYFVTICTKYRQHLFGKIFDHEMYFNSKGKIALDCWCEIPDHFDFVNLGEYVIMPNHVHGIINIVKPIQTVVETTHALSLPLSHSLSLPLSHALPIQNSPKPKHSRFQNPGKSTISSIVGSYKSAVTKLINREYEQGKIILSKFEWQGRFHDHVIRSEKEYQRISEYIKNNYKNWKQDKFYNG
ncbi:MAG: transposase [bacterium]|nr:transposase [bacterium]